MKDKILKLIPLVLKVALIIELGLLITMKLWMEEYFNFIDNKTGLFYILVAISGIIIFAIIIQVIKIAKILVDKRFEKRYLKNLKIINYLLLGIICCFVIQLLITQSFIFVLLIFGFVILTCLLIALQEVFKQAIELQEDADVTI